MVQGGVLDRRGTDGRINTKLITKQLESYRPADPTGVLLDGGLLHGWNVETRDSPARIPFLYGENGKLLYGVTRTRSTPPITAIGRCWKSRPRRGRLNCPIHV
jgi:hypothetical protein